MNAHTLYPTRIHLAPVGFALDSSIASPSLPLLRDISRDHAVVPAVVNRIRSEFTEMPGLSPTLAQAARLFGLPTEECLVAMELLLREEFLRCGPDGQYRIR